MSRNSVISRFFYVKNQLLKNQFMVALSMLTAETSRQLADRRMRKEKIKE